MPDQGNTRLPEYRFARSQFATQATKTLKNRAFSINACSKTLADFATI
jgi:hypothetical protein